jgi:hypothetical protein
MPKPTPEEIKLEWKERIEQQRQSDLSIEKWCRQNQIRPNKFYYWKGKLFPKPLERSSFNELHLKRPDAITLQTSGICVRMTSDCNPSLRKALFTLFAELSC